MKLHYISLFLLLLTFTSCFKYVYHEQEEVTLEGIDVDSTLKIAGIELEEGGLDAVLTIWAMRDQQVSPEQAGVIGELYFEHIDRVAAQKNRDSADFGVWHLAWAISNIYRNGDERLKSVLTDAYLDAKKRPDNLNKFVKIAEEHINGEKIYMGDIHDLGRSYARSHLVVPGNSDYIQSFDEYRAKKEKEAEKQVEK